MSVQLHAPAAFSLRKEPLISGNPWSVLMYSQRPYRQNKTCLLLAAIPERVHKRVSCLCLFPTAEQADVMRYTHCLQRQSSVFLSLR